MYSFRSGVHFFPGMIYRSPWQKRKAAAKTAPQHTVIETKRKGVGVFSSIQKCTGASVLNFSKWWNIMPEYSRTGVQKNRRPIDIERSARRSPKLPASHLPCRYQYSHYRSVFRRGRLQWKRCPEAKLGQYYVTHRGAFGVGCFALLHHTGFRPDSSTSREGAGHENSEDRI